ncbi:hypothetical protein MAIT1_02910 [Magnetofaba australis IT-1]|uniref:Uncharacterized protein n=2 Tax=Magnetofaba TaxID=1472292 RepID=A0A1Y2K813_9PROT|nr:hypothetical protein MAIT1_02910 [Magnetofaba australis IT-1]
MRSATPQLLDAYVSYGEDRAARIHLIADGRLPDPRVMRVGEPPQLVLDYPGLRSTLPPTRFPVAALDLEEALIAATDRGVRLAARVTGPDVGYRIDNHPKRQIITLFSAGHDVGLAPRLDPQATARAAAQAKAQAAPAAAQRLTLEFQGAKLANALKLVAASGEIELKLPSGLDQSVSAKLVDVTPLQGVDRLLDQTGYRREPAGEGAWRVVPQAR